MKTSDQLVNTNRANRQGPHRHFQRDCAPAHVERVLSDDLHRFPTPTTKSSKKKSIANLKLTFPADSMAFCNSESFK